MLGRPGIGSALSQTAESMRVLITAGEFSELCIKGMGLTYGRDDGTDEVEAPGKVPPSPLVDDPGGRGIAVGVEQSMNPIHVNLKSITIT